MRSVFIALSLLSMAGLCAETMVWTEVSEGKKREYRRTVERQVDNNRSLEKRTEDNIVTESVFSEDGLCLSQKTTSPTSVVSYTLNGKKLDFESLAGTEKKTGSIDTKGLPYFGSMEKACSYLVLQKLDKITFFSVQPENPGKVTEMTLSREGAESVNGAQCARLKISLAGIASIFWSATCWVTPEGNFVKYSGTHGPGTPDVMQELIRTE